MADVITTDVRDTLEERGKTHGDYSNHAVVTQKIKAAMRFGKEMSGNTKPLLPHMQETIDMIAHKLGRIAAGDPDFKDHWHDIAGYATLTADRCSK